MNANTISRLKCGSIITVVSLGLSMLFWWTLWAGGGFVGGDVYSYYLPQKQFYADRLAAGEIPLWNNLTGFGYPLVGESQTGVFYPPNLILYSSFSVNTAYNIGHILHYVLAFVMTWLMARRYAVSRIGSAFAAAIYVYSWFPSRTCWEWAIIGGSYLPLAVYCVESYFQTHRQRYLILLSGTVALQCLAGHFNLCFVTLLFTTGISLARPGSGIEHHASGSGRLRSAGVVVLFLLLGLGLASIQLLPSLELKNLSQRQAAGQHHNLLFGFLPPAYWSQLTGWFWDEQQGPRLWCALSTPRDALLSGRAAPTNQIEAQLYCGLAPLLLALTAGWHGLLSRNRLLLFWSGTAVAALLYTGGLFVDWLAWLPGFSYFQGPRRFGILVALAVGMLAGTTWDRLASGRDRNTALGMDLALYCGLIHAVWLILDTLDTVAVADIPNPLRLGALSLNETVLTVATVVVLLCLVPATAYTWTQRTRTVPGGQGCWSLTARCAALVLVLILDLWPISRLVTYSPMVTHPPIEDLPHSPLRQAFQDCPQPVRCYGPGGNFLNVFGVSSLPVYLTFGPAAYTDPQYAAPIDAAGRPGEFNADQRRWLANMGATHVLSETPCPDRDDLEPIWQGVDPVFNRAMNRGTQPLYLYRLRQTLGRVAWRVDSRPPQEPQPLTAEFAELAANQQSLQLEPPAAGQVIFTELAFPGWQVTVDQRPSDHGPAGVFRSLVLPAGRQQVNWKYRPSSVYWGAAASGFCVLALGIGCGIRIRRGQRPVQYKDATQ